MTLNEKESKENKDMGEIVACGACLSLTSEVERWKGKIKIWGRFIRDSGEILK